MYKFLSIAFISLFSLFVVPNALAQEESSDRAFPKSPTFFVDENISIQTQIIGDTFILGQKVEINEEIDGDLFVLADHLIINAPVSGNLRAVATRIEVRSIIDGSMAFISSNVYIPSVGEIETDIYGIVEQFTLEGRIGRNLNLSYSPESNIRIDGRILGNFYFTQTRPNITERGFIAGEIERVEHELEEQMDYYIRVQTVIFKLLHSLSLILIAFLFFKLKNKLFKRSYAEYTSNFFKMLFNGSITLLVAPLLLVILFISIFGIPLALILLAIVLFAIYISPIFAGTWIGQKLFNTKEIRFLHLAFGILIFDVITMAPYIGNLISLFVAISFIGLMVKLIFIKNE